MSPPPLTPAPTRPAPTPAAPPVEHPVGERRLLLLDGHSLAYRAFFALPAENFRTGTGQTTNAVYGFTAMLINLLRDEVPTHVAVAFDVSRVTFRSERFSEYKANRSSTPDDFRGQVDLIKDVLTALATLMGATVVHQCIMARFAHWRYRARVVPRSTRGRDVGGRPLARRWNGDARGRDDRR